MSNRLSFAQIIQKKQSSTTASSRTRLPISQDISQSKYFQPNPHTHTHAHIHTHNQSSTNSLIPSSSHPSLSHHNTHPSSSTYQQFPSLIQYMQQYLQYPNDNDQYFILNFNVNTNNVNGVNNQQQQDYDQEQEQDYQSGVNPLESWIMTQSYINAQSKNNKHINRNNNNNNMRTINMNNNGQKSGRTSRQFNMNELVQKYANTKQNRQTNNKPNIQNLFKFSTHKPNHTNPSHPASQSPSPSQQPSLQNSQYSQYSQYSQQFILDDSQKYGPTSPSSYKHTNNKPVNNKQMIIGNTKIIQSQAYHYQNNNNNNNNNNNGSNISNNECGINGVTICESKRDNVPRIQRSEKIGFSRNYDAKGNAVPRYEVNCQETERKQDPQQQAQQPQLQQKPQQKQKDKKKLIISKVQSQKQHLTSTTTSAIPAQTQQNSSIKLKISKKPSQQQQYLLAGISQTLPNYQQQSSTNTNNDHDKRMEQARKQITEYLQIRQKNPNYPQNQQVSSKQVPTSAQPHAFYKNTANRTQQVLPTKSSSNKNNNNNNVNVQGNVNYSFATNSEPKNEYQQYQKYQQLQNQYQTQNKPSVLPSFTKNKTNKIDDLTQLQFSDQHSTTKKQTQIQQQLRRRQQNQCMLACIQYTQSQVDHQIQEQKILSQEEEGKQQEKREYDQGLGEYRKNLQISQSIPLKKQKSDSSQTQKQFTLQKYIPSSRQCQTDRLPKPTSFNPPLFNNPNKTATVPQNISLQQQHSQMIQKIQVQPSIIHDSISQLSSHQQVQQQQQKEVQQELSQSISSAHVQGYGYSQQSGLESSQNQVNISDHPANNIVKHISRQFQAEPQYQSYLEMSEKDASRVQKQKRVPYHDVSSIDIHVSQGRSSNLSNARPMIIPMQQMSSNGKINAPNMQIPQLNVSDFQTISNPSVQSPIKQPLSTNPLQIPCNPPPSHLHPKIVPIINPNITLQNNSQVQSNMPPQSSSQNNSKSHSHTNSNTSNYNYNYNINNNSYGYVYKMRAHPRNHSFTSDYNSSIHGNGSQHHGIGAGIGIGIGVGIGGHQKGLDMYMNGSSHSSLYVRAGQPQYQVDASDKIGNTEIKPVFVNVHVNKNNDNIINNGEEYNMCKNLNCKYQQISMSAQGQQQQQQHKLKEQQKQNNIQQKQQNQQQIQQIMQQIECSPSPSSQKQANISKAELCQSQQISISEQINMRVSILSLNLNQSIQKCQQQSYRECIAEESMPVVGTNNDNNDILSMNQNTDAVIEENVSPQKVIVIDQKNCILQSKQQQINTKTDEIALKQPADINIIQQNEINSQVEKQQQQECHQTSEAKQHTIQQKILDSKQLLVSKQNQKQNQIEKENMEQKQKQIFKQNDKQNEREIKKQQVFQISKQLVTIETSTNANTFSYQMQKIVENSQQQKIPSATKINLLQQSKSESIVQQQIKIAPVIRQQQQSETAKPQPESSQNQKQPPPQICAPEPVKPQIMPASLPKPAITSSISSSFNKNNSKAVKQSVSIVSSFSKKVVQTQIKKQDQQAFQFDLDF